MIWVCRAGQHSKYYDEFILNSRVYLAWEGYKINLQMLSSREEFNQVVIREKNPSTRTTIANWAGQLYSFTKEIKLDDYMIIPGEHSRTYTLAKVTGEYEYCEEDFFSHSRRVEILIKNLPREKFPQSIQYSLGAYRTLFKAKRECVILDIFSEWNIL